MAFLTPFRSIAPDCCKHVEFIMRYASPTHDEIRNFEARAMAAKCTKSVQKMENAFKYILTVILKRAGINMVIENVPDYGILVSDNLPDKITARVIHDTMSEFGSVDDAVVFKHHAYVWFRDVKDARRTHKLINNMMIDKSIIKTAVVA